MALASIFERVLGRDLAVGIRGYDGTNVGSSEARATIVVRNRDALRYIVGSRGELGFARAYVSGALDVEGDIFAALSLRDHFPDVRLRWHDVVAIARELGIRQLRRLPPPPEEARLRGRRHSPERDHAAVSHHYDMSNDFYRLVLGPSLTYSCAVFTPDTTTLEEAQANKCELVCRKLGLTTGMRLLDIGCGWGSMVLHAATNHNVSGVGVTISHQQVELAHKRIAEAGVVHNVQVRYEDYRAVADGPYDGISSIGMFEHVGEAKLAEYFARCFSLLRDGGRFLNHGISRPPGRPARFDPNSFVDRYVFPDGELHEVGRVVSAMQKAGFEVRHVESLREHYARTLRCWVANLETDWDNAVSFVGETRARIWRLYMAASALNFETNRTQIHQVLAVKPDGGASGMPLRPAWDL